MSFACRVELFQLGKAFDKVSRIFWYGISRYNGCRILNPKQHSQIFLISLKIKILFINGKHMEIFQLKFDQNPTKIEKLDFYEGRGGREKRASNYKF